MLITPVCLVSVCAQLNEQHDAHDQRHVVRMHDYLIHRQHLCLVFEVLSIDLYQLIRQNAFRGLPLFLIRCAAAAAAAAVFVPAAAAAVFVPAAAASRSARLESMWTLLTCASSCRLLGCLFV